MKVKGNHPLAEIIAKKLFSIENVPKEEQSKMVRRAISAAVKYHESEMKVEYKKYEFCKSIHCSYLCHGDNERCLAKKEIDCPFTAKELHQWIKGNNFKIVKDK